MLKTYWNKGKKVIVPFIFLCYYFYGDIIEK